MQHSEKERLAALHELGILDNNTSDYFDSLTRLAADLFGVSGAYISLIDSDRQWLKSSVGFCSCDAAGTGNTTGTARELSFCTHTIKEAQVMVIEDAVADPRFSDNPMVTGPAKLRFYAGAPLITADGYAIGALCITDTQPRQLNAEQCGKLENMATLVMSHIALRRAVGHVDAVSGMPNKLQLAEDLFALAQTAAGQKRVLVYIDMPDAATAFEIAGVLGAEAYDGLVRGVAQKLKRLFAGKANIYHITDARFALLSLDSATDAFTAFVYSLEQALQEALHNLGVPLNLPSFGGIVVFGVDAGSATDARRKALSAVNQALLAQQRWAVYSEADDSSHQRSFRLLNDLPAAINEDMLQLVYQPKHNLLDGSCLSAEALIRWNHPELGAISPAEFIPLVEKTALIRPLSDWVIRTAFRQLRVWHAAGSRIKLAINLSARNFEEPDLCGRLQAACEESGVAPHFIEIECTEGIWMESAAMLQTLHDIRALGMGLALDDFGTGYSNFSYLQKVPATVVKLDQSLIRNVHENPRDQRIVRSLIVLARELGYRVVAEGVETSEALDMIRRWGCDEAQGYLFAKPLAPDAFASHVRSAKVRAG
ncbi:EAL domain-containing protein, partial [Undibacterium sp.]|uniref:sensor domain-containing phosphodiesterase n=1 Tax=Undibacterium sp. TaxID=1914977 RepID=UPI00374D67CC